MSNRSKIMDKYWLEFLANGLGTSKDTEGNFWWWFKTEKVGVSNQKLEDYL